MSFKSVILIACIIFLAGCGSEAEDNFVQTISNPYENFTKVYLILNKPKYIECSKEDVPSQLKPWRVENVMGESVAGNFLNPNTIPSSNDEKLVEIHIVRNKQELLISDLLINLEYTYDCRKLPGMLEIKWETQRAPSLQVPVRQNHSEGERNIIYFNLDPNEMKEELKDQMFRILPRDYGL